MELLFVDYEKLDSSLYHSISWKLKSLIFEFFDWCLSNRGWPQKIHITEWKSVGRVVISLLISLTPWGCTKTIVYLKTFSNQNKFLTFYLTWELPILVSGCLHTNYCSRSCHYYPLKISLGHWRLQSRIYK